MLRDLAKIRDILTPAERRKAAWMLLLVVLMALAETLGVLSIMPFLSVLGRPAVIHENPFLQAAYAHWHFRDERGFILALGLASIAIVVASSLFKTVTLHALNRFVHMERHSISARLLSRYLRQPYEFFLTRNSSILGKNLLSEVDQLLFELIQPLSQLFAQGAIVLAMALLIFLYDPATAIGIVLVLGLLYGAIYGLVRKRLARIGLERQAANGRRYQAASEALSGIKDVKITHSAAAYQAQFEKASRLFSRHMATNDTLSQSPLYLVEATGYSMLIVVALVLLLRSNDIAHVLPALGLYGFAAYRMLPAAQVMYRGFAKLRVSSAALESIHRDLALPDEPAASGDALLAPQREIRLQGIRYAYPSAPDKPVFDGFDLAIPANASIGIAGRSGAGKSTLMDLLLGLLRPEAGTLSVDGVAVDAGNVAAWQRAIGYVPQHIFLADASVAENIAFGVPRDRIDMQAVERAARAAQIHDFVANELPNGYATDVGDRGIRLSGGQRQRVGIARALYRDPPVLFLDEATSALDAQTEEALNEAIRSLSGSKTIVVIAHKEASLRGCQEVVNIGVQSIDSLHGTTEAQ
ncbi:ABC transporter ATP-binding protein [Pseudoluteimonas lycopersici]|uniref:ABC transporter ATP-binding protein n=1 Tax=Pseudoluteimonas lycopersici TaxID=1324796 RepID=A0A516V7L4_9GAMM|nr:ABC transporter ATP-binding protein [Lysobacter lycopersici]QDQ74518.1 ABC transporter ATP-binding protein [Lysobacter lycopersici]